MKIIKNINNGKFKVFQIDQYWILSDVLSAFITARMYPFTFIGIVGMFL